MSSIIRISRLSMLIERKEREFYDLCHFYWPTFYNYPSKIRTREILIHSADHCFLFSHVVSLFPSVRPYFSVVLAEWIIDDTYLVLFGISGLIFSM